jgi:parallel beta-helix repeat protein
VAGLFSSTIHNFATTDYEGFGVTAYGDSLLTINNNNISDYTRDGISINRGGGVSSDPEITISDNTITGSVASLNGVNIIAVTAGTVTGNTVTGNTRSAPWAGGGIVVWTSTGITITNNNIYSNFYGIDLLDSTHDVTISNNILGTIKRGISLSDSDNNIVSGNTITSSVDGTDDVAIGLAMGAAGNIIGGNDAVNGNTITMATSGTGNLYGIHMEGAVGTGNTIKYNTINGGKRGVQVDDNAGLTGTIINNNEIYNTAGYAALVINTGATGATINNNYIHNNIGGGAAINAQTVEFNGNRILNNGFGIEMGTAGVTFVLHNNKIVGNCASGVCPDVGGKGSLSVYAGSANAENNYWGTNVGNEIATKVSANVDYTPWYTDETLTILNSGDTNVGANGGDFVALTVPDYINYGTVYGYNGFQSQEKTITLDNTGTLNVVVTPVYSSGHNVFKYIKFSGTAGTGYGKIQSGEGTESVYNTTILATDTSEPFSNPKTVYTKILLSNDLRPLKGALTGTIYFNAVESGTD